MTAILYATLVAASALAANITTTVWLPGGADANQTFLGSVVEQSGDQTIMSMAFAETPISPGYYARAPGTVTLEGETYVAYSVTGTDSGDTDASPVTVGFECRRESAGENTVPTCTASTTGLEGAISRFCSGLSEQLESVPGYCTNSSSIQTAETQTFNADTDSIYYLTYPLIITAGSEKLGASAVATPSSSSASVTGGSGSGTPAAPSRSVSGASGVVEQTTGGAAPMKTMVPALAGVGAAAAAFFL